MDSFVSNYIAIVNSFVADAQKLGLGTIPLVIVVVVIVNLIGGTRAIATVAGGVFAVIVMAILLENATALSNWSTGLIGGPH